MATFKALESADREALLKDGWGFEEWLDQLEGASTKQMRHMLLNLLFPETFERIASGQERRTVINVFGGLVENPPDDPDRYLHQRNMLR
jgi:5-methylcytosine-specific restriction enzyme B